MGWWGKYYGCAPKGKDRVEAVIRDEGFVYENENAKGEVLDSSLYGSTVYLCCRYTNKNTGETLVYASVCLTHMGKDGYFMIKTMDETMGPCYYDCPKRILDRLDPPRNDWAKNWREECAKRHGYKSEISKLPFGAKLRLNKPGDWVVTVCKYRNRRAYIDWAHRTRFSPRMLNYYGYEIMKEEK